MVKRIGIAAILAVSASSMWAQDLAFAIQPQDQQLDQVRTKLQEMLANHRVLGMEGMVMGAAVKGAPYAADEVRETTQTLGDGTRIHNQTKVTVYRDSEGRIRRETPTSIEIWDSAAGTTYILDPQSMTYQKMIVHAVTRQEGGDTQVSTFVFSTGPIGAAGGAQMGAEGGASMRISPPRAGGAAQTFRTLKTITSSQAKTESLGNRTIEGLNCEGERSTSTIEQGAIGNDRPIASVNERWYSPDLQVTVMTTKSDPRTGTEEFKLSNVRRGEPDPTLFQVPSGYQPAGPIKF